MKISNFSKAILILSFIYCACGPNQHAGGETTNGDGIVVTVAKNSIQCDFDPERTFLDSCLKIQLFDTEFVPGFVNQFKRELFVSSNTILIDSLLENDYVIVVRETCASKAVLLYGIVVSDTLGLYTISDKLLETTSINGTVKNLDAGKTGFVYVKGTDISAQCRSDGTFTISQMPQGRCTLIAVKRENLIGTPVVDYDTVITTVDQNNSYIIFE